MISRKSTLFALGRLAIGFGVALATATVARADGSEGMGTQNVAEIVREQAIRADAGGWQNGVATLVTSGSGGGYGVSYAGPPSGEAGGGRLVVVGNMDGNPVVQYGGGKAPAFLLAAK